MKFSLVLASLLCIAPVCVNAQVYMRQNGGTAASPTFSGTVTVSGTLAGPSSGNLTLQSGTSHSIRFSFSGTPYFNFDTDEVIPFPDYDGRINFGRSDARWGTNYSVAFIGNGSLITSLTASQLTGMIPTARLGSGTANSTTFLAGDQTWKPISGGSGFPLTQDADMGGFSFLNGNNLNLSGTLTVATAVFGSISGSGASLTNASDMAGGTNSFASKKEAALIAAAAVAAGGGGGGGGGTNSPMVCSNILVQSTNEIVWDIQRVQHLTLRLNTNLGMLTISNAWAITNAPSGIVQLDTWEDTNGTWRVISTNIVGGLMRTFSGWIRGTNASQYDMLSLRLDGTLTNVLADWKTNAQPVVSFTNTLAGGGGGGGGGSIWTIVGSALGDTFDANGCNSSAHPLNATGANLLVAVTSFAGGSDPVDFTNNTVANTWTLTTGFTASSPRVVWQYVISPNVTSSMVFTNPVHSTFNTPFVVYAIARTGGAPTFGSEAITNYFDWRSGGTPAGTANGAPVTPFGSSDLILSGITYDADGSTTLSVDSSFTKVSQIPISGGGNFAACAATKIKSSSSTAEDPGWFWSSATPFATISIDNITFH